MWNGRFWAKSWPEAFWSQILAIWRLLGRNYKSLLGLLGNGRFGAKPGWGPFWRQMLAPKTGSAALTCQKRSSQNTLCRPKVPKTAPWTRCAALIVPRQDSAGRQEQFSKQDFPSRTRRAGSRFWSHGALFCVSEARNGVFGSPGPLQSLFWAGFSDEGPPGETPRKHEQFPQVKGFSLCIAQRCDTWYNDAHS